MILVRPGVTNLVLGIRQVILFYCQLTNTTIYIPYRPQYSSMVKEQSRSSIRLSENRAFFMGNSEGDLRQKCPCSKMVCYINVYLKVRSDILSTEGLMKDKLH